MHEIMTLVQKELVRSHYRNVVPAGLVLTGGSSLMSGLTRLASDVTGFPARTGLPEDVGSENGIVRNPVYATGVGLLQYGAKRYLKRVEERPPRFSIDSIVSLVKSWFKEFF